MESTTTSILAGADLWVAVSSGLGLLLVGVGLGYFISQYLRKNTQQRLEEAAEDRARRRLEEEVRNESPSLRRRTVGIRRRPPLSAKPRRESSSSPAKTKIWVSASVISTTNAMNCRRNGID